MFIEDMNKMKPTKIIEVLEIKLLKKVCRNWVY
jgi:hypothetical protein